MRFVRVRVSVVRDCRSVMEYGTRPTAYPPDYDGLFLVLDLGLAFDEGCRRPGVKLPDEIQALVQKPGHVHGVPRTVVTVEQ